MNNQLNKLEVSSDTPVPKRSLGQRLGAVALILLILLVGFMVARQLIATKPTAKKKRPPKIQTLVQVIPLKQTDVRLTIEALGTVIPARKVDLKPQVSGPVISINPRLIPGGLVQTGENLVILDDRDYQLAMATARSGIKKAEMDLKLEEGSQAVARREYQLVKEMTAAAPPPDQKELALRGPQLAKIRATLDMARVELNKAQLNLERTRLQAPFNAVVLSKDTEVGALVSSQVKVATLVGTDSFWVELTLPRNSLQWLQPINSEKTVSSPLKIFDTTGSGTERYQGRIVQLLSDIEPGGLQARILVAIDDPMGLKSSKPQLLLGSFVRAEIQGKELTGIFRLPRTSLLPGSKVLLASTENSLVIRQVKTVWQDSDWIYVSEGLKNGENLIISPVASSVEGMMLNIAGKKKLKPRTGLEQRHDGK